VKRPKLIIPAIPRFADLGEEFRHTQNISFCGLSPLDTPRAQTIPTSNLFCEEDEAQLLTLQALATG
jgi:hypothetical protein